MFTEALGMSRCIVSEDVLLKRCQINNKVSVCFIATVLIYMLTDV